jgi:prophage regulatory protein
VREKVIYSPAHIARLEAAGQFPKRVRLGTGRVGWVEQEIDAWITTRIAERDADTGS